MKVLLLSYYFPPDLSAGSFRSYSLVESLLSGGWPETVAIEVVTTLPNRYSSFAQETSAFETRSGLSIHRIKTSQYSKDMLGQCKAFAAYARGVAQIIADNDYDIIYATSSRLMTAILGAHVSRKLKKPLYLDIRDIFVDTIGDVLPQKAGVILGPFFSLLERYAVNSAAKVNLVSAGFLPYFEKRYPNREFDVFTNGIDNQFLNFQPESCMKKNGKELSVLYAGNIGDGQGLHHIVPHLAIRFQGKLSFKIIGDGSRARELLSAVKLAGCQNVVFLPPVKREVLIELYQSADVLFLHLNNFDAFKKVLPSKLFEYAAVGKPIWAGVSGHAAEFIAAKIENAAIFPPCNVDAAVSSFENLEMVTMPRRDFADEFSRDKIMKSMAQKLIKLSPKF